MKLDQIIEKQRGFFLEGKSKSYDFRIKMLKKLRAGLVANEEDIFLALQKDLGKSNFESYITEYSFVLEEIDFAIKNLKKWMKTKKASPSLSTFPAKSFYGMTGMF